MFGAIALRLIKPPQILRIRHRERFVEEIEYRSVEAGDGEPGVHYFPLRRLMAGAVTSQDEPYTRCSGSQLKPAGLAFGALSCSN